MSYITYNKETVATMTDAELIKNILGDASIVSNNSSKYINEYMDSLYTLLMEKDRRKLIHTLEKKDEPNAGSTKSS